MAQPVVHFEIIGKDPAKLRSYFGELFGWEFDTSSPVAEAVSEPDDYGFVNRSTASDGTGIPGGRDVLRRRGRCRSRPAAGRAARRQARDGPRASTDGPGRRALHRPGG